MQAHDEPQHMNTNETQSLDCIDLFPIENDQGGYELLHSQTNKVLKRQIFTKIPITPSIIKQVPALATLDNMLQGFKIINKENNLILDSSWIEGVDHYEGIFDNDEYEEENDTDDNKKMMPTITNTMKWMRTSLPIFYRSQITSRFHIKLKNNKIFFE